MVQIVSWPPAPLRVVHTLQIIPFPLLWRFTRYLLFWPLHLEPLLFFQMRMTYPPSASTRGDLLENSWPSYLRLFQREHPKANGRQCRNRVMLRTFITVEVQNNLLVGPFFLHIFHIVESLSSCYHHRRRVPCSTSFLLAHKDSWWIYCQGPPIVLQQSVINIIPRNNHVYPEVPGPEARRYHHESSTRIRWNKDCTGASAVQAVADGQLIVL